MTAIIVAAFFLLAIIVTFASKSIRDELWETTFFILSHSRVKNLHIRARLIIQDEDAYSMFIHSEECNINKNPIISPDLCKALFAKAILRLSYPEHLRCYLDYSLQDYAYSGLKIISADFDFSTWKWKFVVQFYFTLRNKEAFHFLLLETERQLYEFLKLAENEKQREKIRTQLREQCGKHASFESGEPIPALEGEPPIQDPEPEERPATHNPISSDLHQASPGGEYPSPVEIRAVTKIPPSMLKKPERHAYHFIIPHTPTVCEKHLQIPSFARLPELPDDWEWIVSDAREPDCPGLHYAEIQHKQHEYEVPNWELTTYILQELGFHHDTHLQASTIRKFINDREAFDTPISIHGISAQPEPEPNVRVKRYDRLEYGEEVLEIPFAAFFPIPLAPEGFAYINQITKKVPTSS